MTFETFADDEKTIDAVERCLQRITEAARKLGDTMDRRHPSIPWWQVRNLGSVLRHDYDHIALDRLWATVTTDLATLRDVCESELRGLGQRIDPVQSDRDSRPRPSAITNLENSRGDRITLDQAVAAVEAYNSGIDTRTGRMNLDLDEEAIAKFRRGLGTSVDAIEMQVRFIGYDYGGAVGRHEKP